MENQEQNKLNILQSLELLVKAAAVMWFVFTAIYALNSQMTAFIAEERAAESAAREKEYELRRLQEDYDREYEIARAFADITCHYDGQFLEIFEKRVSADYIFLGTSHFTHGVTPEAFEQSGKRFFNFALNGSNPSYYVWWYNDVFKPSRYVKPKAVIFGVNWFMFDTDWLWRRPEFDFEYLSRINRDPPDYEPDEYDAGNLPQYYEYSGKWYDIDALALYITSRFAVFSSRDRLIEMILPEPKEIKDPEIVPENREREEIVQEIRYGARERCRLDLFYKGFAPYVADFGGHNAGTVGTNYKQEEEAAFIALLKQFESDGIPVVFVMAPEYLPGRTAPQFERMTEIITEIARERNIPFLNYNTDLESEINNDYNYYSDWGHLNDKGAHIFSQRLYDDLNKILEFDK
jgi:hypothetical protein